MLILNQTEAKKEGSSKKKDIDKLAEERQKKMVLSETQMKELEEKYKALPEKDKVQK